MQKKDEKLGNKTANKQEIKGKGTKQRPREKDQIRFAKKGPNFCLCACVKNK